MPIATSLLPFLKAIQTSDLDAVEKFLDTEDKIQTIRTSIREGDQPESFLYLEAIKNGSKPDIVRRLLAAGFDQNGIPPDGMSPIIYAIKRIEDNATAIAIVLAEEKSTCLNRHEYISFISCYLTPPEMAAWKNCYYNLKVVSAMINTHGPNLLGEDGYPKLMHIAARFHNKSLVDLLLGKGVNVHTRIPPGWKTGGEYAVESAGYRSSALGLQLYQAELDQIESVDPLALADDKTYFWHYVFNDRIDMLRALFKANRVSANHIEQDGTPVFHRAIFNGPECIQLFLEYGASPLLMNNHLQTPLMLIVRYSKFLDLLLDCLKTPEDKRAYVRLADDEGNTALHYAAKMYASTAESEVLAGLIEAGAEVDSINDENETALHLAARIDETGDEKIIGFQKINFLLMAGANPLLENDRRKIPLALAAPKTRAFQCLTWAEKAFSLFEKNDIDSAIETAILAEKAGYFAILPMLARRLETQFEKYPDKNKTNHLLKCYESVSRESPCYQKYHLCLTLFYSAQYSQAKEEEKKPDLDSYLEKILFHGLEAGEAAQSLIDFVFNEAMGENFLALNSQDQDRIIRDIRPDAKTLFRFFKLLNNQANEIASLMKQPNNRPFS